MDKRKQLLLRIDPAIYEATSKWASDDLRSVNAQIEVLLRNELKKHNRLPKTAQDIRKPGRPPKNHLHTQGIS